MSDAVARRQQGADGSGVGRRPSDAARPAGGWYLAVCAAFVFGLLSKSMLVTLPILLLLVDVWPLERWQRAADAKPADRRYPPRAPHELIVEKMPLFVIALLDGIVTICAQGAGSAFTSTAERLASTMVKP